MLPEATDTGTRVCSSTKTVELPEARVQLNLKCVIPERKHMKLHTMYDELQTTDGDILKTRYTWEGRFEA